MASKDGDAPVVQQYLASKDGDPLSLSYSNIFLVQAAGQKLRKVLGGVSENLSLQIRISRDILGTFF